MTLLLDPIFRNVPWDKNDIDQSELAAEIIVSLL